VAPNRRPRPKGKKPSLARSSPGGSRTSSKYGPFKAGKPSQFRIHLTDLSDGSPVEQAEVTLSVRAGNGGSEVSRTKAKIGKVTGIYVAEVSIAQKGEYGIEFHVKNAKLDERMPLGDFKVE
jgi:hypothetical protein